MRIENTMLDIAQVIAQAQQAQSSNPLINQRGEDAIYIGVGLLAIVAILTIGIISRRIEHAIVFSIIVAAVLILIAIRT